MKIVKFVCFVFQTLRYFRLIGCFFFCRSFDFACEHYSPPGLMKRNLGGNPRYCHRRGHAKRWRQYIPLYCKYPLSYRMKKKTLNTRIRRVRSVDSNAVRRERYFLVVLKPSQRTVGVVRAENIHYGRRPLGVRLDARLLAAVGLRVGRKSPDEQR